MMRVLIVEDSEINQDLMRRILQRQGFEVKLAADGIEGLSKMEEWKPDIVLLDLSLPRLDGWDVARRAKQTESLKGIPIIALTAHAMEGDRQKALSSGCDEYEKKPVDRKSLLKKMETLLSRAA